MDKNISRNIENHFPFSNYSIFAFNEPILFVINKKYKLYNEGSSVILFKPDCFYKRYNGSIIYNTIRPLFEKYINDYKIEIKIDAWLNTKYIDAVKQYTEAHYLPLIDKYGFTNEWLNAGFEYIQNKDKNYSYPIEFIYLEGNVNTASITKQFVDYFFRVNYKLSTHNFIKSWDYFSNTKELKTDLFQFISKKDNLMHASDNGEESIREFLAFKYFYIGR